MNRRMPDGTSGGVASRAGQPARLPVRGVVFCRLKISVMVEGPGVPRVRAAKVIGRSDWGWDQRPGQVGAGER